MTGKSDGDRGEMLGALETLGVEFVNILGTGWASREPAAGRRLSKRRLAAISMSVSERYTQYS
jgi:hypothetical protein